MTTQTSPEDYLRNIDPRHVGFMSTDELEELLDQIDTFDDDEFLTLGLKVEKELDARELEASLPAHDDTPSLADEGIELGSYAS